MVLYSSCDECVQPCAGLIISMLLQLAGECMCCHCQYGLQHAKEFDVSLDFVVVCVAEHDEGALAGSSVDVVRDVLLQRQTCVCVCVGEFSAIGRNREK